MESLPEALMVSGHRALLDGDEGGYGVTFVQLPGCCAMGSTREEAISNAREALADWLGTALEADAPPPRKRTPSYSAGMTLAAYASGGAAAQDAEARTPEGLEGDALAAWGQGREAGMPNR